MKRRTTVLVFGIALLLLAAPAGAHRRPAAQSAASISQLAEVPRQDDLRVLVWNVQLGANEFTDGPEKARAVIRAVQPDVVLLQESYDIDGERPTLGRWLASELGWNVWQGESRHLCVLTHLEIDETFFHHDWHGVGARLVDGRGRAFVAYSIWIDSQAYTPYHLRDDPDVSDEALLLDETARSGRFLQATAIIEHLQGQGHTVGDLPLLVGGDWNSPSHLDWTTDSAKIFRFRRALDLPVSRAMSAAGFADAFRQVHSDPVRSPGITWSPLLRGTARQPETADRIDRLYFHQAAGNGRLQPTGATVIPLVLEDASIPQSDRLFPSDHGGVVVDLRWQ